MMIIVHPNKLAPDGMVGVSELVDRCYTSTKKVIMARGCFDDTKGDVLVKSLAALPWILITGSIIYVWLLLLLSNALAHAVELTRQGAVDSLRFAKGELFQAFQMVCY